MCLLSRSTVTLLGFAMEGETQGAENSALLLRYTCVRTQQAYKLLDFSQI